MRTLQSILAVAMLASAASAAFADKPKWTPPQAAFDACAKSKAADPCTFTGRRGHDVKGSCALPADGGKALVCKPAHPMHDGGGAGSGSGSGSAAH